MLCQVKPEELLALPGPFCWLKPVWLLSRFLLPGDIQCLLEPLGGGATPMGVWKLVLCWLIGKTPLADMATCEPAWGGNMGKVALEGTAGEVGVWAGTQVSCLPCAFPEWWEQGRDLKRSRPHQP